MILEAEGFMDNVPTLSHEWVAQNHNDATNDTAMFAGPDDGLLLTTNYEGASPNLRYQVKFSQAGIYYVWVRGAASGSSVGTSDSVHVGLNGESVGTADSIAGFGSTFGWRRDVFNGGHATLEIPSPGLYAVDLWAREDGFLVDKIILTTNPGYTPEGEGAVASGRVSNCGDGQCTLGETCGGCAMDCGACPTLGMDSRPDNATCVAPPKPSLGFRFEQAWSNLTFDYPVGLVQAPNRDDVYYVLEKRGGRSASRRRQRSRRPMPQTSWT